MIREKKLQEAIDKFAEDAFGSTQSGAVQHKRCVCCGKEVMWFRDGLSEKEYSISGLCQACQDEVFG